MSSRKNAPVGWRRDARERRRNSHRVHRSAAGKNTRTRCFKPTKRRISIRQMPSTYRGRLAPSPTGYLHLGHARTFWIAFERARSRGGTLIFRNEDLDAFRSKPVFAEAMVEDLRWLGLSWEEGPDVGGNFGPYLQSQRLELYRAQFEQLRKRGAIYPCTFSPQHLFRSLQAPHQAEEEPIYPGTCRNN